MESAVKKLTSLNVPDAYASYCTQEAKERHLRDWGIDPKSISNNDWLLLILLDDVNSHDSFRKAAESLFTSKILDD
jgi:hypothetical protein